MRLALCAFLFSAAAALAQDIGGSILTSSRIALNSSVTTNIDSANDLDFFYFDIPDDGAYFLVYTTGAVDTVGTLFDAGAIPVATDDNSADGSNFRISRAGAKAGRYFVKVAGFQGRVGQYRLVVEYTPATTYATPLQLNASIGVNLQFTEQIRMYSIDVPAPGGQLKLYTLGGVDTYGWLYDSNGTEIKHDDDAGEVTNFLIVHNCSPGRYYLRVSSFNGDTTGIFSLRTEFSSPGPVISVQPTSTNVIIGQALRLTVGASGFGTLTYGWFKDGIMMQSSTSSDYIVASASMRDAGQYRVVVATSAGVVTSSFATVTVTPGSALSNLSVRTSLGSGQTLIVGGVISGAGKPILVRAAGPALAKFGLPAMPDPRIEIYSGAQLAASNDNWSPNLAATFTAAGAFPFDPGSLDAALAQPLSGSFTVQAKGSGPGTVLVEAYDTTGGLGSRMINLSARNQVGTGSDLLIAGFAISGTGSKRVLIRAIGPTLSSFGVSGALQDPRLAIFNSTGTSLAENDNWDAALAPTFSSVGAFALTAGSRDSAIVVTLLAGQSYTVQVSGVGNTTGEALIEVYEVL